MPKPQRVPGHVKKALRGEIEDPQLADLAAHFFQMAGGTRNVARMLLTEYNAAAAGSLIRSRILDMLLRVTRFANEKAGVKDQLGLMSDEDLEQELERTLRRSMGREASNEEGPERTTEEAGSAPQGAADPAPR